MTPDYTRIGQEIKEARHNKHMSQAALAEAIDCSVSYMSYIETGKKQLSLAMLIRAANVLGVTVDRLLTGNQDFDSATCTAEVTSLLEGCTTHEKHVILATISTLKRALRENAPMQSPKYYD